MAISKDSCFPVPAPREQYGFDTMVVGESIFVENQATSPNNKNNWQCSASPSAHQYGARAGKRFSSRNVPGGVRIWRIA